MKRNDKGEPTHVAPQSTGFRPSQLGITGNPRHETTRSQGPKTKSGDQ